MKGRHGKSAAMRPGEKVFIRGGHMNPDGNVVAPKNRAARRKEEYEARHGIKPKPNVQESSRIVVGLAIVHWGQSLRSFLGLPAFSPADELISKALRGDATEVPVRELGKLVIAGVEVDPKDSISDEHFEVRAPHVE